MKKSTVISAATAIAILMGSQAMTAASQSDFKDMDGHWAAESVSKVVASGYVDGYDDGTFKPEQNVTRAEFMAMVVRGMKESIPANKTDGSWFDPYKTALAVIGAYREGDFEDGDFNKSATRLEMVKIALKIAKPDLQPAGHDLSNQEFMYNAVKLGLVQGVDGGQLDPEGKTTRAQAVTIVERVLNLKSGKELEVDKFALAVANVELSGTNVDTIQGLKLKPRHLNEKFSFGDDAYAMVTQVILADPANPKDPFLSMFDINKFPSTVTKEDSYIAAVKYSVHVGEQADKDIKVYDLQHFPLVGKTGNIEVKNPLQRVIQFSQSGDYEGWIAATVKKSSNNVPTEVIMIHLNGRDIIVAADPARFKE